MFTSRPLSNFNISSLFRALLVLMVTQDHLALRVPRDLVVPLDPPDLRAVKEQEGRRDHPDRRENK